MRLRMLFVLLTLVLQAPLQAQDSDFPTLDALANVTIPAFDYVDMVGRMSQVDESESRTAR